MVKKNQKEKKKKRPYPGPPEIKVVVYNPREKITAQLTCEDGSGTPEGGDCGQGIAIAPCESL